MKQHRFEIRDLVQAEYEEPQAVVGWRLFVDGDLAAEGPLRSRDVIEELTALHQMVAAEPDTPRSPIRPSPDVDEPDDFQLVEIRRG